MDTSLHAYRGLLTGKFKRDKEFSEDPESSRVAWVEADKSRSNQSHPSLQEWAHRETFWQLTDTLTDIATTHGLWYYTTYQYIIDVSMIVPTFCSTVFCKKAH